MQNKKFLKYQEKNKFHKMLYGYNSVSLQYDIWEMSGNSYNLK